MKGTVVQINVSKGGIPKLPVGVATVTERGVVGDDWAHPRFHGGPKQALLLISTEDLDGLKALGYPVYPGALGENLTISGIDMRAVRFGDRFEAGDVLLEITKLRQPCRTLDLIRKGIQLELYDTTPGAANWGRGGFYARVIEGGTIRPGDIIAKAEDPDV
jgi:MOSC domain-containing protein YiiM